MAHSIGSEDRDRTTHSIYVHEKTLIYCMPLASHGVQKWSLFRVGLACDAKVHSHHWPVKYATAGCSCMQMSGGLRYWLQHLPTGVASMPALGRTAFSRARRAGQGRAGQGRAGQGRAGQGKQVPDQEQVNCDSLQDKRPLHLDCHLFPTVQPAPVHLQHT